MQHLLVSVATFGVLLGAIVIVATGATSQDTPRAVRFGMDSSAVASQAAAGVAPDYGTFWIGPWTLTSGWGGPDGQLASMRNAGVTPAIHFYYWGDDISVSCVENGCWSDLHDAQKTRAGWQALGRQLTDHLNAKMGGAPAVVFLESEFNKGGISTYEPFDGYMAEMANSIHAGYPAAQIVLGFGNWGSEAWGNFDRAAAASDLVGVQGMRGSTRENLDSYHALYDATLVAAKRLQSLFHKPIMLTDIALSSYPEPSYLAPQKESLAEFFAGLGALKEAGVEAMIYRSWRDSPNMDLANYYGQAERHWGLAYASSAGGAHKPAAQAWIDGVRAERANPSGPPAPPAAPVPIPVPGTGGSAEAEGFEAKSAGGSVTDAAASGGKAWNLWSNGYMQQRFNLTGDTYDLSVRLRGTTLSGVGPHVVVTVGGQTALVVDPSTSYREFSTRIDAPGVQDVRITFTNDARSSSEDRNLLVDRVSFQRPNRAPVAAFDASSEGLGAAFDASASSDPDGDALSYAWSFGDGSSGSGLHANHSYGMGGTYTVSLTVSDGRSASTTAQSLTVFAPNRSPQASFTATMDGMSLAVDASASSDPDADPLTYAWTFGDGSAASGRQASHVYAASGTYTVSLSVADGRSSATTAQTVSAQPAFAATFKPATQVNEWWVEVVVTASGPPAGVSASVNGGPPIALAKTSWGAWAKSFQVARGSSVVFSAHDGRGHEAVSPSFTWLSAPPGFTATFAPRAQTNNWWVETAVSSQSTIAKVEARVDDGAWTTLSKTSWGTWAKSIHVLDGHKVLFRATAPSGATATSPAYVWG